MTAKDLFGLIVRVAGLTFICFAAMDFTYAISTLAGWPLTGRYPAGRDAVAAAFFLIIGAVLFFAATPITRLAYWRDT
jgi:hypothetical protein